MAGRIEIGIVSRPHGVRGELRVRLHNPESTALDVVDDIFVGGTRYGLASARRVKGGALIRLQGLDNRDQVEELAGTAIEVLRDQLELEEDDVLLEDLRGCKVELEDGSPWGEVVEVVAGIQDLLVVHDGPIERYLPLVEAFVRDIDLEAHKIVVAPPEELPEWEW